MFKWNRVIAAALSATLMFSMAPAAAFGAENADTAQEAAVETPDESEEEANEEVKEETKEEANEAVKEETEESSSQNADEIETNAPDEENENESAPEESNAETEEEQPADVAEVSSDSDIEEASEAGTSEFANSEEEAKEETEEDIEIEIAGDSTTKEPTAATEEPVADEKSSSDQDAVYYPGTIKIEAQEATYDLGDTDRLFEEYANKMFYGDISASNMNAKSVAGSHLDGLTLTIYQLLKDKAEYIAGGSGTSAYFEFTATDLGLQETYTAEDLGLAYLYDRDTRTWNEGIDAAVNNLIAYDFNKVFGAFFADCAYEVYWGNGSLGQGEGEGITYSDTVVDFSNFKLPFYIGVNPAYKKNGDEYNEYSIDTDKTGRVSDAVNNAKKIVANAEGKSDYYKLDYFKEKICDMVSYDKEAAANSETLKDRSPWALVNVFDGNTDTNVVCEGYAEAFQYLTELTSFDDDTYAYSVTGTLSGGTGAGGHKWNIVHIDNANYMADITNSDGDTIGVGGELFLKGMTGSVSDGYQKTIEDVVISYTYDEHTTAVYTPEELTLSPTDYVVTPATNTDDIASLKAMNIYLTDKIGLKVYVEASKPLSDTDKMVFTYDGTTVEQTVAEATTEQISDYDGSQISVYVFTLPLWAKQMRIDVSFHMVVGGNEGTRKTYSVYDYGREILKGNPDEKTDTMIRSMLNYGGYTQQFFNYDMNNLAFVDIYNNDPVPEWHKEDKLDDYNYILTESDNTEGFHFTSATLNLGTLMGIKLYYTVDDESKNYTFDSNMSGFDFDYKLMKDEATGRHYVLIKNVKPQDYNRKYNFVVRLGMEEELTSITYSPFSYIKAVHEDENSSDNLKYLCSSLYLYWEAANAMVNENDD